MQVRQLPSLPPSYTSSSATQYAEISSEITRDFGAKINLGVAVNKSEEIKTEADVVKSSPLDGILRNEQLDDEDSEAQEDEDSEAQEDEEFSFVCANPNGSPISADDAFYNGQIRPIYPMFDRDLLFAIANDDDSERVETPRLRPPLRKVFVEKRDTLTSSSSPADELEGVPQNTYCEWSPASEESSPELGRKSNSTGFSKLWRIRDLVHRSSSDGKDAFVFLNNPSVPMTTKPSKDKAEKSQKAETEKRNSGGKVKVKGKQVKEETVLSAHERHYVRNRAKKEEGKRRSYLPYRPDLVGFFTSVNGLSKNVHPF